MSNTIRFSTLLGECRRQMNGAVAGSMRYYGADYGLNYGVSIPTLRLLAEKEGIDHSFALYLYQQQVREIQLISLHLADPKLISTDELDFWAKGIINSEIAEEAAFALFKDVDAVTLWLGASNELLVYTALLSISKARKVKLSLLESDILNIVMRSSVLTTSAIVTLLENYYRDPENRSEIEKIISILPNTNSSAKIKSEMEWRCLF